MTSPAKPVVLVPYDPGWPATFAAFKEVYARALGDLAQAIEHVGSTSVLGLVAKPIIDIDIVIASTAKLPDLIRGLSTLGYRHNGDQGVPGREAFAREGLADVPRDGSGRRWPAHNLYACAADAAELRRHLLFRDWLRAHPARAEAYGALKRHLAEIYRDDRDRYCEAKSEFIEATIVEASRGA
jgi:GrpB-like predicted nucleotidyltransferase (UPF0157 family)